MTIALVPTMGALHGGHVALLRAARRECDRVVMSLFVNPTQFAPGEDFDRYPRDEQRDRRIAAEEGVNEVYAPSVAEMYPDGFSAVVRPGSAAEGFEGDARPGHFEGVATVVMKLLNRIRPEVAYFGQKDAQQVAVIRQMVRDLDVPVQVRVVPTVREPDGL
ncbi:MAG: 4-phosphopantoate--beta-alanine ligase, partial [Gaiellales bacterium]